MTLRGPSREGPKTLVAKRQAESLAGTERRREEVCELENCKQALQRVKAKQRETGSRRSRNTATVFDPGGSAKQAVHEAQQHIAEGYRWVVDLDWEKFFDRVHHDRLIAAVAKRVADEQPWGRPHCGCR